MCCRTLQRTRNLPDKPEKAARLYYWAVISASFAIEIPLNTPKTS